MKPEGWITTYPCKKEVYPFEPKMEDLDIMDVAQSLSIQSRFHGFCKAPFSVAQHVVNVKDLVKLAGGSRVAQMLALQHDTPEAYLSDVARPLKQLGIPAYREAEKKWDAIVEEAYITPLGEITDEDRLLIKRSDRLALIWEMSWLKDDARVYEYMDERTLDDVPFRQVAWSWSQARSIFLGEFYELFFKE